MAMVHADWIRLKNGRQINTAQIVWFRYVTTAAAPFHVVVALSNSETVEIEDPEDYAQWDRWENDRKPERR